MARTDWAYPNISKPLIENVVRAIPRINAQLPRPKYRSVPDFVTAAVVELLEKEGQLEERVQA